MKLTKNLEAEILRVYNAYWDGYLRGDVESMISLLDSGYTQVGSAETEVFSSKKDAVKFLNDTIDQVAGKLEMRNRSTELEQRGNLILIHELCDVYVLADAEWIFYSRFRASTLMRRARGGWKILHQHSSFPDARTGEGENIATEKIAAENLELREAVKRRTIELEQKNRELETEAALERVRAVAMGMKEPADMLDVCRTISDQLQLLNVKNIRNVQTAILNDDKGTYLNYEYFAQYKTTSILEIVTKLHPKVEEFASEIRKARDAFFTTSFEGTALKEWIEYRKQTNQNADPILEKAASVHYYFYSVGPGALGLSAYTPLSEEEINVFKRFRNVFDLAYRRFMDIQQAEAQAREAKIEAALERTRTRSMLMQHSNELDGISRIFHEQLLLLGIDSEFSFVWLPDENKQEHMFWATWVSEVDGVPLYHSRAINYPLDKTEPGTAACYVAWESGEPVIETYVPPGDIVSFFATWEELLRGAERFKPELFPEGIYYTEAYMKHGCFGIDIRRQLTDDEKEIIRRFAIEFERAYTRFLDLQKAEAQAREAQIETALERVRSRSMAMQKSDELKEVIQIVYQQFVHLNIHIEHTGFILDYKARNDYNSWIADHLGSPANIAIPYFDAVYYNLFNEAKKNGLDFFAVNLSFEEKNTFYRDLFKHLPGFPEDSKEFILSKPALTISTALLDDVALYIENFTGIPYTDEENVILKRFGKVFQQTYTRFLDLKKAEAQAREAQIELSLEKIRAKVTAMKESSDLLDIVVTMRAEFVGLGHEAHYFWHMRWLPDKYEKAMTSGDGTRIGMVMTLPRHIHGDIKLVADWEKSDEPTVVLAMDVETAVDYVNKMITLGDFQQVDPQAPTLDDIRHIGGLTFVMARTTHGEIGYSLPGVVSQPPAEDIATLVRFAGVFDLAYRRFEDLQTSERQNRESQIELALERVRARALAMQDPGELVEVAQVLRKEMGGLGVEELETSTIFIHDDGADRAECWFAIKDTKQSEQRLVADHITLDLRAAWVGREMRTFFDSDRNQISIPMKGTNRREWIEYCYTLSPVLDGFYGKEIPDRTYHLFKFSNGAIGAAAPGDISDSSWGLLSRAASVFSLAYSRFKDLSQARLDLQRLKEEKKRAEEALTELRATQEQLLQQEKLASLGQLTAGIAHEIKNPLNFVNNFSSVSVELVDEAMVEIKKLSGNGGDAQQLLDDVKKNLNKIIEHGTRADGIVKSMLQHSRGGSGKKEATDLNALVKEYVNLAFHGMRAGKNPINVDIALDFGDSVGKVPVIAEDFSRVIINLCQNAFDAMREKVNTGGNAYLPKLTVRTRREADKVIVEVGDNGPGIRDEIKDKILQPFFTTKKGTQGTGLGLSITHDIVKAHGGDMRIETNSSGGATFRIAIPA